MAPDPVLYMLDYHGIMALAVDVVVVVVAVVLVPFVLLCAFMCVLYCLVFLVPFFGVFILSFLFFFFFYYGRSDGLETGVSRTGRTWARARGRARGRAWTWARWWAWRWAAGSAWRARGRAGGWTGPTGRRAGRWGTGSAWRGARSAGRRWAWIGARGTLHSGPSQGVLTAADDHLPAYAAPGHSGHHRANQIVAELFGTQAAHVTVQLKQQQQVKRQTFSVFFMSTVGHRAADVVAVAARGNMTDLIMQTPEPGSSGSGFQSVSCCRVQPILLSVSPSGKTE